MEEEVRILKALWTASGPVNFDGRFHSLDSLVRPEAVATASSAVLPRRRVQPGVGVVGQARRRAPVLGRYLRAIAENIAEIRARARQHGREDTIRFGMRLQIICREREEDAWAAAHELLAV